MGRAESKDERARSDAVSESQLFGRRDRDDHAADAVDGDLGVISARRIGRARLRADIEHKCIRRQELDSATSRRTTDEWHSYHVDPRPGRDGATHGAHRDDRDRNRAFARPKSEAGVERSGIVREGL